MIIEECKSNIKNYVQNSIENLEQAMNIIECNFGWNNSQNEEIDDLYNKLSAAIEILESI